MSLSHRAVNFLRLPVPAGVRTMSRSRVEMPLGVEWKRRGELFPLGDTYSDTLVQQSVTSAQLKGWVAELGSASSSQPPQLGLWGPLSSSSMLS